LADLLILTAVGRAVTKYSRFVWTNFSKSSVDRNSFECNSTAKLRHPTIAIAGAPLTWKKRFSQSFIKNYVLELMILTFGREQVGFHNGLEAGF